MSPATSAARSGRALDLDVFVQSVCAVADRAEAV